MADDPWSFGWSQLLTIIGFLITVGIALAGFRGFRRWRREKLEEQRIEIAFEALALSYESKYVFDEIRSPLASSYEWQDMQKIDGETDDQWMRRGPFYAVFKRLQRNKDFFERVFKLQPRCMAVFGPEVEQTFLLLHRARQEIEISCDTLLWEIRDPAPERDQEFWRQCRRDIFASNTTPEKDRVGKKLLEFQAGIEQLCRPVIDRRFGRNKQAGVISALTGRLGH